MRPIWTKNYSSKPPKTHWHNIPPCATGALPHFNFNSKLELPRSGIPPTPSGEIFDAGT